ncbi:ATP-dependent RNA helicase DDX1-like [Antedon mediterranea]|uniref:ATP-dependent RNA helicase DDX1-like n=1 Tax=Antedon mediterranea TaxID=105859 RepID=UPI003AF8D062
MTAFAEMGMMPEICQAVEEMDWLLPTDVQNEAIPLILGGGDVLMAAETGSGKTGAFCLPVLQIVFETMRDLKKGKKASSGDLAPASGKWTMNSYDRDPALAIDKEGLLCQSRELKSWHGTRANFGVYKRGKHYFEATVTDEGLCRVGWATSEASLNLGTDKKGFGYGGTAKKSFGKQFDDYGETYGIDDTIGCYLDLDEHAMYFSKNGVDLGLAFELPKIMRNLVYFPAVVLKNAEMNFNFGDSPFKYPPCSSFTGMNKAPADCIVKSPNFGSGPPASSKLAPNAPQAVIIEPSRELAEQTLNQFTLFKKYVGDPCPRELLVIGGQPAKEQMRALQSGVDIVVGTPGRLDDFISTGKMALDQVRFFILDEADGLLSAGYGDLINRIWQKIPKISIDGKRLQLIVCSATLHSFDVKKLAEKIMHFPTWVDLKGKDSVPETVHHVVVKVDPIQDPSWQRHANKCQTDGVHSRDNVQWHSQNKETMSEAVKILKPDYLLHAIKEHNIDQGIIFCRTKVDCDNVERFLTVHGGGPRPRDVNSKFSCVCLHGDRSQQERRENLKRFKNFEVGLLICTDVAARGIDISGVPYVINVTMPDEKQNYVHRIGRVGRAYRMGLAISLVSSVPEKVWYHSCPSRGKNCNNT